MVPLLYTLDMDPYDRLLAGIVRQALIDAQRTGPHAAAARAFLDGSGLLPTDRAPSVEPYPRGATRRMKSKKSNQFEEV